MRASALAVISSVAPITAIRRMSELDLDPIARLFVDVQREIAPEPLAGCFESYIADAIDREFRRLQQIYAGDLGPTFWVLELDGEIVGTVGLLRITGRSMELRHLYVSSSHRRRGLGWALLHEALDKARELGAGEVWLSASELQGGAIEMFRTAGFRRADVVHDDEPSMLGVGSGIARIVHRRRV